MATKTSPKVKGKKPPKWLIPVVVVAGIGLVLFLRKKSQASGTNATEPGAQGLSNQSFIPVTGENVPGVGAGGYGGASGGESGSGSLLDFFTGQLQSQEQQRIQQGLENKENRESEREFWKEIVGHLGTGGGAPVSGGNPGTITTEGQGGAKGTGGSTGVNSEVPHIVGSSPQPITSKCPSSYPNYNPANGAPGPKSCWKYSKDRCPPPRIFKHVYEDGNVVCAST